MSSATLGRLQSVDPRSIWKSESGDFTPWLAQEENLELLAATIGLDLELEATEKNVGPFRADILCKDTASNSWVLIENQLERTDHSHLGQLLTYAAGLKAVTIVWVATAITPEHRAALDWLNEVTAEGINFFGLEIELWQIGDSVAAPKFNIISQPNDWAEAIRNATTAIVEGGLTDTKQRQRAYWQALGDLLKAQSSKVKPQRALPQHWATFALGKTNVYLTATVNTVDKRIGVQVTLAGDTGKSYFAQLLAQRHAVETQFGAALEWRELPGKKESQVGVVRPETDPSDEASWGQQHAWMKDMLERLHAAFAPRAKALAAHAPQGAAAQTNGGPADDGLIENAEPVAV